VRARSIARRYYWASSALYLAFGFYALFEWMRHVVFGLSLRQMEVRARRVRLRVRACGCARARARPCAQRAASQAVIILVACAWGFARAAVGLLYDEIAPLACYPKAMVYSSIESYLILLMCARGDTPAPPRRAAAPRARLPTAAPPGSYSLVLLFFVDCYVSVKLKTDRYKWPIHGIAAALMLFVYLFFALTHYVARRPAWSGAAFAGGVTQTNDGRRLLCVCVRACGRARAGVCVRAIDLSAAPQRKRRL
jgi:hypothetical protein